MAPVYGDWARAVRVGHGAPREQPQSLEYISGVPAALEVLGSFFAQGDRALAVGVAGGRR
jgi:hypothetical protein